MTKSPFRFVLYTFSYFRWYLMIKIFIFDYIVFLDKQRKIFFSVLTIWQRERIDLNF